MTACDYKAITKCYDEHLKIDGMAWRHAGYGESVIILIVTLMNKKVSNGG